MINKNLKPGDLVKCNDTRHNNVIGYIDSIAERGSHPWPFNIKIKLEGQFYIFSEREIERFYYNNR